jgi:hypothetical protein
MYKHKIAFKVHALAPASIREHTYFQGNTTLISLTYSNSLNYFIKPCDLYLQTCFPTFQHPVAKYDFHFIFSTSKHTPVKKQAQTPTTEITPFDTEEIKYFCFMNQQTVIWQHWF